MTKEEQINYVIGVLKEVKSRGLTIQYFLSEINVSRTHWYFIKNGERKLTDDKEESINRLMKNTWCLKR